MPFVSRRSAAYQTKFIFLLNLLSNTISTTTLIPVKSLKMRNFHKLHIELQKYIIIAALIAQSCYQAIGVGVELPATNRLPRWRIGERPPDMEVSCELSRHLVSDEQAAAALQRQSHQNVEVVGGWRRLLPLNTAVSRRISLRAFVGQPMWKVVATSNHLPP